MVEMNTNLAPPKSNRPWSDVLVELEGRHRAQTGPRWYLVQCAPGETDKHVCDWLKRNEYEHYYPQVRTMRLAQRRKLSQAQRRARIAVMREVLEPMFRRYVFTRFDMHTPGWREVFDVAGVKGIACEGGRYAPISDDLIARLRAAEVDGAIPGSIPASQIFHLGQLVEVIEGPFASFRGEIKLIRTATIDGVDSPVRLTAAINIFGRLTPAEFELWQVEPVNIAATL